MFLLFKHSIFPSSSDTFSGLKIDIIRKHVPCTKVTLGLIAYYLFFQPSANTNKENLSIIHKCVLLQSRKNVLNLRPQSGHFNSMATFFAIS